MSWRQRFGLKAAPLPRGACGRTFYDGDDAFLALQRVFAWLAAEPGLGVLTGEPGVGKTAALRHLCDGLPKTSHRILYLGDSALRPHALYSMLADLLGVRPTPRARLLAELRRVLVRLVDEQQLQPIVILDDAQRLSDDVLAELASLANIDFDGRDLVTIWLLGHPLLERRLAMQQHAALAQRVIHYARLGPKTDRAVFDAMLAHGLKAAGALRPLLTAPAHDLLFRASRGVPRLASNLLRAALRIADERDLTTLDDHVLLAAIDSLRLAPATSHPTPDPTPPSLTERGTKSRK